MGDLPGEIVKIDITEIGDFDNLHDPRGILKTLQERTAVLYGAEESFYLVNGSTGGILSAVSAAVRKAVIFLWRVIVISLLITRRICET